MAAMFPENMSTAFWTVNILCGKGEGGVAGMFINC